MTGQLTADVILPSGALVAAIVLGLVELALAVFCIIDIVRRPAVLGGRKWVWVILVIVFNLIGSIIYLAVGRVPPPAAEPAGNGDLSARSRTQAAADLLYGPVAVPGSATPTEATTAQGVAASAPEAATEPGAGSDGGAAPDPGSGAPPPAGGPGQP